MIVNHGAAPPLLDQHKQVLTQNMCCSLSSVCVCVRANTTQSVRARKATLVSLCSKQAQLWFEKIIQTLKSCHGNIISPLCLFNPFALLILHHYCFHPFVVPMCLSTTSHLLDASLAQVIIDDLKWSSSARICCRFASLSSLLAHVWRHPRPHTYTHTHTHVRGALSYKSNPLSFPPNKVLGTLLGLF